MKFNQLILFILFIAFFNNAFGQELNVATFNIRYKNNGDKRDGNGWDLREPVISNLIKFHDFDIFGAQEVLNEQLNDLSASLPTYSHIGVGRDNGKEAGEYAPIFYKKEKFKLLKEGHFWLSENTEKPNKGWDAALPRICTWGQFQEVTSGLKFFFFNTHFDHVGVVARRESSKLILEKIKQLAGAEPTILTGDFNVDQNNEIFSILSGSELKDAFTTTEVKYANNGTFNHFDTNAMTDSRIDHIFLSNCSIVKRYGVLTDTYRTPKSKQENVNTGGNFPKELKLKEYEARLPSDHFPVMIVVDLQKCK
ncbi:MAG: endonuclease/exonuclease/phosphatase family protein [Pedobacter sp.]|nr:MAG: endonuclease/exonuclease/phosphatase family protein [Pedobacter sp.]